MGIRSATAREQWNQPHVVHVIGVWNLFGDPFALSTLSAATVAWIVALTGGSLTEKFPPYSWWGLAWQFIIILFVLITYLYELADYYKGFLSAASGVALVYTSNTLTQILYFGYAPSNVAASAGFVVLSIVNVFWLIYFGSDNASPTSRWIDSFSINGIRPSVYESSLVFSRARKPYVDRQPAGNGFYSANEVHSQNYMSSTALNGFENTDPHAATTVTTGGMGPSIATGAMTGMGAGITSMGLGGNSGTGGLLHQRDHVPDSQGSNTYITDTTNGNTETTMGDTLGLYSDVGDELISFPYTARALYAYVADTSDAYEISFQQGEILRVGDIEGRWWKAKRSNGETGIIPSNYVELIDDPSML